MTVAEAMKQLTDEEAARLLNDDEIKAKALAAAEQNGIVFLDEMDKIAVALGDARRRRVAAGRAARPAAARRRHDGRRPSTGWSRPITSCSSRRGAFHLSKPSDLIPELQGRFPIRVELDSLSVVRLREDPDRHRRLPRRGSTQALLATEQVQLDFQPDGIRRLAEIAFAVNEKQENIGARRLYTVMERLLDDVSFHAARRTGEHDRDRRRVRRRDARRHRGRRQPRQVHPLHGDIARMRSSRAARACGLPKPPLVVAGPWAIPSRLP